MSTWKTVSHKEDKEGRKKRNATAKETHEIKAKLRAKRKNKQKEQKLKEEQKGKEGKTTEKNTQTKSKEGQQHKKKGQNKKKQEKKDTNKVEFVKCEKSESKEGCADLWCPLSHKSCRQALDCNKEKCSYIHLPSPLETPNTREECLIFNRLYQFSRLQSATNPKQKAAGKLTFDKFFEKIGKSRYPCDTFINLRGDWTWQKWAEAFETEHKLEKGYFTNTDLKESDLAQLFEFFFSDAQEHWYLHKEHFMVVEEDKKDEEKDEEEEENEEEQQVSFDNEKIDAVLKEASGKTFAQILEKDFPTLNEDKKLKQALNCWKCVFYARASKALISLNEEEAIHLLDILIEFVDNGKTELEPFDNLKFEVDPVLLGIKKFKTEKEIAASWKKFVTDKKTPEILETLAKATGASPLVSGFSSFPSLTVTFKFTMNVFLFPEPSLEKHVEACKKVFKQIDWIFTLADIMQKTTGDFYVYESLQDAKNYGPLFDEFKKKILENWK